MVNKAVVAALERMGGGAHPPKPAVAILRTSTGVVIIVTLPTILGGGRPARIGANTIHPGCHDDKNQRQIESNNPLETSPLTRIFTKTRNRGWRLRAISQITRIY